ncbi:MAG: hypothetical protein L6R41_005866 [Letrouitia leprolyta]|nr:MAG: hypothetical protein L6R41_005866 [Letrouitia leprolyta]
MKRLGEPQGQEPIAADEDYARRFENENEDIVATSSSLSLSRGAGGPTNVPINEMAALEEDEQTSKASEAAEPLATQLSRLSSSSSLTVCWCKDESRRRSLRLLRSTPEQYGPFRGINSSGIQEKMHELKGYDLKSFLELAALNANLLWDMLQP